MILMTFQAGDSYRLGVKTSVGVVDVAMARAALGEPRDTTEVPETIEALLRGGAAARKALESLVSRAFDSHARAPWLFEEADLRLGPCVPSPGKIICVGLNYRLHAAEADMKVPETPVLFSKFNNSVAATGESIPLSSAAVEYDYEAELAVVIGRRAKHVETAEALHSVFGYCNANDLSARDLQRRTTQWLLGKTPDKFLPIGPYLVTADEVADPQTLDVRCWVNDELRQNSNTKNMIFSVAELVSYISRYMTLEPGDLVATGTPEGVVLGMAEKVWLRPGDEVTVEVGRLGRLTNVMTRER